MNLYFRFFLLLLKRLFFLKKSDLFLPVQTSFRVNPMDLDFNFHVNNGRYLSIMDLGRFDLMLRAGVFWKFLSRGYYPVVVSESIRFLRSLRPFESFRVETQIESWDEKDLFLSQKFISHQKIVAMGYIKGRFKQRGRNGSVPTSEIFEFVDQPYSGSRLSTLAQHQTQVESSLKSTGLGDFTSSDRKDF